MVSEGGPEASRRPRVVSLLPSATEIVARLGCAAQLVGISHECDFPPEICGLPVLTRSRLADGGSSRAIDAAVRAVIDQALSLYAVDAEALRRARPDVVLTQDLCEVCAVSLDDVRAAVARLAEREQIQLVSLSPTRLQDVLADIERVAAVIAVPERGRAVRAELQARIDGIAARARAAVAALGRRPRVVSIEWLDPLMLGGTWMPELIELAGGQAVGARAGEAAPTVSVDELVALAPEVVVIKPCGFSSERTLAERELIERVILASLGPEVRVVVSDGNAYFNRPGPRLVESLEVLAACIHPRVFDDFATVHAAELVDLRSSPSWDAAQA